MIKITFCLRRLPSLSQAQFLDYWYTNHAPLVRKHAAVLRIRRYIQLVPLDSAFSAAIQKVRGAPAAYDGVAELWFDSIADIGASYRDKSASVAGRELLDDEKKFVDLANSPLWYSHERVIIGSPTEA